MGAFTLPEKTRLKYRLDTPGFNRIVKETIKDVNERYLSLSSNPGSILVGIVAYFDSGAGSIPVASGSSLSSIETHQYTISHTYPQLDTSTKIVKLGIQARGASVIDYLIVGHVTHIVVGSEERALIFREIYRSVIEGRPHIVALDWARECCRQEAFVGEF
jgi:hypothetical protein